MKVQKIVSLDENTMRISQKMGNFSQWVRIALRSYENGEDLATETMRRIKWAKVANILAATIVEHSIELDDNYKGSIEELIAQAMSEVQKQTSLRDFEWIVIVILRTLSIVMVQEIYVVTIIGLLELLLLDLLPECFALNVNYIEWRISLNETPGTGKTWSHFL